MGYLFTGHIQAKPMGHANVDWAQLFTQGGMCTVHTQPAKRIN